MEHPAQGMLEDIAEPSYLQEAGAPGQVEPGKHDQYDERDPRHIGIQKIVQSFQVEGKISRGRSQHRRVSSRSLL